MLEENTMDQANKSRFIELRAAGHSYNKIAKKLKISKPTLIKWSREFSNDIKNAKLLELESLREEYQLGREHRLRVLGTQLSKFNNEILKRDLTEIPTWRIFDMQQKIIAQIAKENEEIEFTQEINKTPSDVMIALSKKTIKWTG